MFAAGSCSDKIFDCSPDWKLLIVSIDNNPFFMVNSLDKGQALFKIVVLSAGSYPKNSISFPFNLPVSLSKLNKNKLC